MLFEIHWTGLFNSFHQERCLVGVCFWLFLAIPTSSIHTFVCGNAVCSCIICCDPLRWKTGPASEAQNGIAAVAIPAQGAEIVKAVFLFDGHMESALASDRQTQEMLEEWLKEWLKCVETRCVMLCAHMWEPSCHHRCPVAGPWWCWHRGQWNLSEVSSIVEVTSFTWVALMDLVEDQKHPSSKSSMKAFKRWLELPRSSLSFEPESSKCNRGNAFRCFKDLLCFLVAKIGCASSDGWWLERSCYNLP